MRVRKAKEDGGGTSFADYVWKPVVLIEMKKHAVNSDSQSIRTREVLLHG